MASGYFCEISSATDPPPTNGSLKSVTISGKSPSIFLTARDLPPGYLKGVFNGVGGFVITISDFIYNITHPFQDVNVFILII